MKNVNNYFNVCEDGQWLTFRIVDLSLFFSKEKETHVLYYELIAISFLFFLSLFFIRNMSRIIVN